MSKKVGANRLYFFDFLTFADLIFFLTLTFGIDFFDFFLIRKQALSNDFFLKITLRGTAGSRWK